MKEQGPGSSTSRIMTIKALRKEHVIKEIMCYPNMPTLTRYLTINVK